MFEKGAFSFEAPNMSGAGQPDDATDGEPDSKRQRMSSGPQYAMVSCFDDPDKHVEVDLSLLDASGCRLGLLIRNSEPSIGASGRPFYRAGNTMTRAMLITMVKSMSLGQLVLSRGVTIGEALSVLEYEGVMLQSDPDPKLSMPRAGLAFSKRGESIGDSLQSLCERVADAIVQWPRLESVMNSAMPHDVGNAWTRSVVAEPWGFSSTATRAWLRFAERPKNDYGDGDHMLSLATKNPRWLVEGLVALGIMHYRMAQENKEFGTLRDEGSFRKLYEHIEKDPLCTFYQVRLDACKASSDVKTRKELTKGEKFCAEIRNSVLNPDSDTRPYARAAVMLVDYHRKASPICSRIFSGACADEAGSTPERVVLKKALKARGVSIVRWMDTRDPSIRPIVFPPSWRDSSNSSCYGPSVLLSFENIM
jgi:hypothetical protein